MPRSRDGILNQVLTVAQMRAAEDALIVEGASVDELMQRAGQGAGEWVRRIATGGPVTVLCGPGNNGGDGWVIAEYLREHGNPVSVIAAREPATEAARRAQALYCGETLPMDADISGTVFVDCLFGSGLTRPLPTDLAALLMRLVMHHRHAIAIDVPSGLDSDTGQPLNAGLPGYGMTIALGAWKHAHFAMPAATAMGTLRLVDIGIASIPRSARALAKPRVAAPAADSHKYRRGMLGIVAGEMPGASLLAAQAALRAGAGYVKLAAQSPPQGVPPELVTTDSDQTLLDDARVVALLIGPGLGRSDGASRQLAAALHAARPCVIDADALILLRPEMLGTAPCVLTPHEGEMAELERTFGLAGDGLRRDHALALAEKSGAVIVLKGPDSLIAGPSGELILAPRASSWLSVAGTGDVLAGTIASRLATHGQALRAAEEGLWLHAEAARRCGAAFTAGELALGIQAALRDCIE
ncbi:NAD(P)H-hydrate dehydratase [Novosphingobium sp. ERN07]|uniref:NAD(P)H-hydrate dehydratase n=1 Tax=Novosphingobium sp. ERN07 TaxID=2726187 RepID=UPI00145781AB|nr:NAD(P)H-hydrate dehydratase [Novosphingobium sp. ERN07]NLR72931.1 NAD(P)H-hydrate dehydratase [Novosphingobium sp. ERN07]